MRDMKDTFIATGIGVLVGMIIPAMFGTVRYDAPRSRHVAVYDVNGDGLEDVIEKDGKVSLQQRDGSYIPLEKYVEDITDSYRLRQGEDGLYRTIGFDK